MDSMKTVARLVILFLLAAGATAFYAQSRTPCVEPIGYSIGSFDQRFGITKQEFAKVAEEAESIWEKSAGRQLFKYDPAAKFKVNLIYDDRQKMTQEYSKLQSILEESKGQFESVEDEYKALSDEYDGKKQAYEDAVAKFGGDLASYNADVDKWNRQGGAPEREFKGLQARKAELDRRADAIEEQRQELNSLGRRINLLAEEGRGLAESYNDVVSTYNQRFGTTTEFDQGVYRGDRIDIYEFKGFSDLRMVIAHEFGHALGIGHVENAHSIMYYLIGEQNLNRLTTTTEDLSALKAACRLE